ncbi:hypothetical protein CSKR_103799 [Clonorchis sinensis]|uniref:Uncharacterized protein n=1 Tax=Clonorchis sinensis TaxID=79923 RepID=A0A3R7GII0_CLOSI|nr:hypothetical protein CSKR_103799 [Clonorchis sinensis]
MLLMMMVMLKLFLISRPDYQRFFSRMFMSSGLLAFEGITSEYVDTAIGTVQAAKRLFFLASSKDDYSSHIHSFNTSLRKTIKSQLNPSLMTFFYGMHCTKDTSCFNWRDTQDIPLHFL